LKSVFVTGGTGLIGHFLLLHLLDQGCKIMALYRETIPQLQHDLLTWVPGDILDALLLRSLVKDADEVYHCAGYVSYAPQDEDLLEQINVNGTANVVDACLENPHVILCHISSIAAINRAKGQEIIDESAKWNPAEERSAYATSKYFAEMEVWRGISEGLKAVIVNPSIVLGPGDWSRSSTQLFKYVLDERAFYAHGYANFVDVRDVVKAIVLLMETKALGERFILNAHQVTYLSFFRQVAQLLNKKAPHIAVPSWVAEVLWRLEAVRGKFIGVKPLITKETARIAKEKHFYSNAKVKMETQMEFRPLEDTLLWCCQQLKPHLPVQSVI
jgi:dihydroflavonol-4-reductase